MWNETISFVNAICIFLESHRPLISLYKISLPDWLIYPFKVGADGCLLIMMMFCGDLLDCHRPPICIQRGYHGWEKIEREKKRCQNFDILLIFPFQCFQNNNRQRRDISLSADGQTCYLNSVYRLTHLSLSLLKFLPSSSFLIQQSSSATTSRRLCLRHLQLKTAAASKFKHNSPACRQSTMKKKCA